MESRFLDFFALGVLIAVAIGLLYATIYIHEIPYNIAKKRKHPHLNAIHTAGWVSLFLMHALWPFLWIWATLYVPDKGFGLAGIGNDDPDNSSVDPVQELKALQERVAALEERLNSTTKSEIIAEEA